MITPTDLSDTERTADALRDSEDKYRALFENSRDAIMILEPPTWTFTAGNPATLAMFGVATEAEFVACAPWELSPERQPDGRASSHKAKDMIDIVTREGAHVFEWTHRRIDGSEFVADVTLVRIDRKGIPIIFATVRDITDRKRVDAERDRLTTAIEQAGEVVVVTDTRGDIVYVNPSFETVTGYTRAEALGRNPRFLKSGDQDAACYRGLWAAISTGTAWHGRMVNRKKAGALYTQDATISPVRDVAGEITGYVAVSRDITQELALQAQFLQSQKIESVGRLAGGIAHDFNNLLSVILNYADFALETVRESDPLHDDLLEIKKAGVRAAGLTRQLLAFSRKQVLQPRLLDLNQTLTDVEKMLRRIIGEDIILVHTLEPKLGLVRADVGQIEQVIMNLVVNARDAMPRGGALSIETSNVELDASDVARDPQIAPGPYVMIAITDSGIGMDEPTMAQIFEPFFTTKEVGKGTGLGLSTVYGIVRQSGGSVRVLSKPGTGTTFQVLLPQDVSAVGATAMKSGSLPRRGGRHETILVVDDEEALLKVAKRTLYAAGYTVLTAVTAKEAIATCAEHAGKIDLLLADVVMPMMGGVPLARLLEKSRPALKVLYMSGYTGDAIANHDLEEIGANFLVKPFTVAELTREVRHLLDAPFD